MQIILSRTNFLHGLILLESKKLRQISTAFDRVMDEELSLNQPDFSRRIGLFKGADFTLQLGKVIPFKHLDNGFSGITLCAWNTSMERQHVFNGGARVAIDGMNR
jgi:hypothetical protein